LTGEGSGRIDLETGPRRAARAVNGTSPAAELGERPLAGRREGRTRQSNQQIVVIVVIVVMRRQGLFNDIKAFDGLTTLTTIYLPCLYCVS
jgi:hypothetical protein